jgi:hypothetical protein
VKLKSLLVITLLVIGCSFASAQAGTFGFGTAGGDYLYCNYIQLSNYSGAVWQGVDNLSACGHSFNATVVGVSGKLAKALNPFVAATVNGATYADNLYDAYSYGLTGAQWDVTENKACTNLGAKKAKIGWVGIASASGFVFGANYGTLACSIPGKGNAPVKGLSIGNAKAPHRK